ncbi:MAG: hypothetical protein IJT68_03480 [Lentisphaeria bacterium]|nr:hypothetical protein [Lentisphaeria bacterium]
MKPTTLPPDLLRSKHWEWHIPSEKTAETVRGLVLSAQHLVKSTPVRAVYHCEDYFLKFELATNLMTSFRNRLHPKAGAEYEIGQSLAAAGIPAVECIGWGKLGGTNVLITRAKPGFITMDEYFYTRVVYGGESFDGVLPEITSFLRKFFDAGFYHGDMHFGNILYNSEKHELAWVDLIAISHMGKVEPAARRFMCRCIVSLREGLSRTQLLHAIRELGAAETDTEAETFYFSEIMRTARHLVETWEKRSGQALGGYSKFADAIPCPGAPGRTMLLRKDWLGRPLITKDAAAHGLPAGHELFRAKDEAEAETLYLRSIYLQTLRIKHRRIVAFARPDELWLEPLPAGLEAVPSAPDDADTAFFRRTLEEQMIEAPADAIRRLPDGSFYLTGLTRLKTGFEA